MAHKRRKMWKNVLCIFVRECSSTFERFIKPICKTTITTFACKNFERKNISKKVAELQITKRFVWKATLFLQQMTQNQKVFSFPIFPEPACFTYPNGIIRQNDKSSVFHHLTKDFQSNPPDTIETAITDGMFILNLSTQNLIQRQPKEFQLKF